MSAEAALRRAIKMMQAGDTARASASLRELVADPTLDNAGRAAAYLWLAEASADRESKSRLLERALACEPENKLIHHALRQLQGGARLRSRPPPPRISLGESRLLDPAPKVIGIDGGVNGPASAVFVHSSGLLATSSYAAGCAKTLRLSLDGENLAAAAVVRRFPAQDLALIQTPFRLSREPALAAAPPSVNLPILAVAANGARLRCLGHRLVNAAERQWLATNLPSAQVTDAGGNPLYDDRGLLVGVLTRNADADGMALAITGAQARALSQDYLRERQTNPDADCCPHCGGMTRAPALGGGSCEVCGGRLGRDGAKATARNAKQLLSLYGKSVSQPCPRCRARVGRHRGRCLRCGRTAAIGLGA